MSPGDLALCVIAGELLWPAALATLWLIRETRGGDAD